MPAYPRAELEEMVQRWLEANRAGEKKQDWRHMADLYTEDATYGWNVGPNDEFMVVGREEIREVALGLEMVGLEGWTYPYQKVLIDDAQGEVIGLWKQVANARIRRTAPTTRSPVWAAAGSATAAISSGPGSETSSTSGTRAPSSWR